VTAGAKVSTGSKVSVHYTGSLEDGRVFDSSEGREPLEFVVGEGDIIPGFEKALVGMRAGEEKTVTVPPEDAYGAYDPELVIEGPRDRFPEGVAIGQSYTFHLGGGREVEGTILEIKDQSVVVDFNHPLAGKRLTFKLKVLKVD